MLTCKSFWNQHCSSWRQVILLKDRWDHVVEYDFWCFLHSQIQIPFVGGVYFELDHCLMFDAVTMQIIFWWSLIFYFCSTACPPCITASTSLQDWIFVYENETAMTLMFSSSKCWKGSWFWFCDWSANQHPNTGQCFLYCSQLAKKTYHKSSHLWTTLQITFVLMNENCK